MRSIFLCFILFFASDFSIAKDTCKTADSEELIATWVKFRDASLNSTPEEIAKFYEFPIQLYGPDDGAKPLLISKSNFLKKYKYIFREIKDLRTTYLFRDLNDNPKFLPKISSASFDRNGCYYLLKTPRVIIRDYTFEWRKITGWKVISATVDEDFSYLEYDGYPLGKNVKN